MSEYSKIDELFGMADTETAPVDLPGGGRVLVRGLTRYEHILIGRDAGGDPTSYEPHLLAMCMVEPTITLEKAQEWYRKAKPAVIGAITDAIRDLSGLGEGAAKSDVSGDGPAGK